MAAEDVHDFASLLRTRESVLKGIRAYEASRWQSQGNGDVAVDLEALSLMAEPPEFEWDESADGLSDAPSDGAGADAGTEEAKSNRSPLLFFDDGSLEEGVSRLSDWECAEVMGRILPVPESSERMVLSMATALIRILSHGFRRTTERYLGLLAPASLEMLFHFTKANFPVLRSHVLEFLGKRIGGFPQLAYILEENCMGLCQLEELEDGVESVESAESLESMVSCTCYEGSDGSSSASESSVASDDETSSDSE